MLLYYITDRRQFAPSGQSADQTERRRRRRLLATIEAAAACGLDYIELRERDLPPRQFEALAREALQIVRRANRRAAPHSPTAPAGADEIRTRLLVHSRLDVALAAGADGVHLPADGLSAAEARAVWQKAACNQYASSAAPAPFGGIFAVSCQAAAEVRMAEAQGADFVVFAPAPVFEKLPDPAPRAREGKSSGCQPRAFADEDDERAGVVAGVGLAALRQACAGEDENQHSPASPPRQTQSRGLPRAPSVEGVGSSRMPVLASGGITLENASACLAAGAAGIAAIRLFQENDMSEVVARLRSLG